MEAEGRRNEKERTLTSIRNQFMQKEKMCVSELLFMAGKKLAISNVAVLFNTEVTLYDARIW